MSKKRGQVRSAGAVNQEPRSRSTDWAGLSDISAVESLAHILGGITALAEALRGIAEQKTEQARIAAKAQTEIERVHAMREVLLQHLDRSFEERRVNFDALFSRLDSAIEKGNLDMAASTLDAVVKLAQSSPFKDLADVANARKALQDQGRTWEF
ncbi:hypothetical protein [Chondromyces crocatus]|uniref:Uncharacterized protein n=1 Tax=Chondromyces crocatus TaxID=52 RepID=A0A0K1EHM0_CHOCO|nr:hypothetical protein [Chondromyces crocatus]AKT40376.1 uncharacterized protein CMC5_045290 [Chondromyces crocatus]